MRKDLKETREVSQRNVEIQVQGLGTAKALRPGNAWCVRQTSGAGTEAAKTQIPWDLVGIVRAQASTVGERKAPRWEG